MSEAAGRRQTAGSGVINHCKMEQSGLCHHGLQPDWPGMGQVSPEWSQGCGLLIPALPS